MSYINITIPFIVDGSNINIKEFIFSILIARTLHVNPVTVTIIFYENGVRTSLKLHDLKFSSSTHNIHMITITADIHGLSRTLTMSRKKLPSYD